MNNGKFRFVTASPLAIVIDPQAITERRIDADYYKPSFIENESVLETCGYSVKALGQLWIEGKYGTLPDSSDYAAEGIVLIRGGDFQDLGVVDISNLVKVPVEYWQKSPKARTSADEILLLAKGATIDGPNSVALCPPGLEKAIVNGSVFRIRLKDSIDAAYLAAFMASKPFLMQKRRSITNLGISYNDLETIENFLVPVPPRPLQTYIGAKVRLAEQCRRNGRELWSESQDILEKALSLSLKTTHWEKVDPLELRSTTYNLVSFEPSATWVAPKLIERELGAQNFHPRRANVILKLESSGIEIKRLSEIATRKAQRVTASQLRSIPYYVGLAEIDSTTGYFDPVLMEKSDVSGTSTVFQTDDILFSKLRPYLNKVSICPPHIKTACGSTELLVYRVNKPFLPYYIFFLLKSSLSLYQIIDVTAGSTLPRVDPEIVDDILVPMIPSHLQKRIDRNVRQGIALQHKATKLIREAKADLEALIEGRLDVAGIINGRIQSPTWASIQAEITHAAEEIT